MRSSYRMTQSSWSEWNNRIWCKTRCKNIQISISERRQNNYIIYIVIIINNYYN